MKYLTKPITGGMPGRGYTHEHELQIADADGVLTSMELTVPANSLVRFLANRLVAFNSGGACTLSVGKTGAATAYINALDVKGATGINSEAYYWFDEETVLRFTLTSAAADPTTGRVKIATKITRLS